MASTVLKIVHVMHQTHSLVTPAMVHAPAITDGKEIRAQKT